MQHIKRWLTALVIVPLLLWLIIKGSPFIIALTVSLLSVFAIREYLKIIFINENIPGFIWLLSFLSSILIIADAWIASGPASGIASGPASVIASGTKFVYAELIILTLLFNFLALIIYVLINFSKQNFSSQSGKTLFSIIARQFMGIIYVSMPLSLLVFIFQADKGLLWIIWLFVVVFLNDTCAFYTGTFFGKKKIAPVISPNKTIEGSLGGIAGSVLSGFILSLFFFNDFYFSLLLLPCSFLLAIAGQAGDLFESAIKRASGIKDSGIILPGHGGILDRIDGLLVAIPVFYAYMVFVL